MCLWSAIPPPEGYSATTEKNVRSKYILFFWFTFVKHPKSNYIVVVVDVVIGVVVDVFVTVVVAGPVKKRK